MTAMSGSKVENYITYVLEDLGLNNKDTTTLYCRNMIAIIMDKSKNTNERNMHIQIQHLPLQEWVDMGQVLLENIRNDIYTTHISTNELGLFHH